VFERRSDDSVYRETLWKIMKHYKIPDKITQIVQNMYNDSQCAVLTGNGTKKLFEVKYGVRQGCNMSSFLFLLTPYLAENITCLQVNKQHVYFAKDRENFLKKIS
jgi:hypothetical protein